MTRSFRRLAAGAACLALLSGAGSVAEASIIERIVAVVGERPILLSDLRHRARPFLSRIYAGAQGPAQIAASETQMFKELLNRMIDDRLEEHAAEKARISVSVDEVDSAIRNIAAQAKIEPRELVAEAKRQGLTEQDYRDELRRQVLEGKLVQLRVRGRVKVSEEDGKVTYAHWLKESGEQVDVRILAMRASTIPAVQKARALLVDEVVRRARAGEDFCKLVAAYSDDAQTNQTCGSRGLLPMDNLVKIGGGAVEPEDLETPQSADTQYGYGPIGMAIWEERPYWYQDFVDDPISVPWQMCGDEGGWIASASLPLFHNQVVTGVFVLYSGEINAFDESARNLLTEIAANISFALDNFTRESLRKKAEEEIEHLAFYDALTSLPNRRLLHRRLQQRLNTTSSQYAAVLMLDLDNFKHLNDTMGHHIGDLLLIEVAVRLHACVQAGDTVARLGGDEFIVILAELDEAAEKALIQADAIGNKILAALCQPYLLKGSEYRGSTSIGISLFNSHELTETELLKRTDTAMYQAKNAGGNTKRFYDPAMQATLDVRLSLARDLHCALAEKQLSLYYQGQVDQTGHVLGAEALLRWRHPEYGLVSPRMFIPLAEEKGMIMSIGHWVLETACVQLKAWEADPLLCDLKLAVNVSARQFYQSDFVEQVLALITTTGIDPNKLKLELTESVVMDDIDSTIVKMHALRQNGVSFSLDDFGTGYSSLSYLTLLPVDQLKIDQSFVHNIGVKDSDAIIVQTIIGMAHNLGMEVFAEGVETEGQRTFLERHGCGFYQGYLFSKPLPVQEFETLFLH